MTDDWLDGIVLLNESSHESLPGDICIFRSAGDACQWLEHWWVEEKCGFAFTASGDRLKLGVDTKGRVFVDGREVASDGLEIVLGWLRASATALSETRRTNAKKAGVWPSHADEMRKLPADVAGLIAYIGYLR